MLEDKKLSVHPVACKLQNIINSKKTCLALSADVTSASKLLHLAESLGSEICVLKTHIDILTDFSPAIIDNLKQIAQTQNFLIFEDRKFADIGHTVKMQYHEGIYKISSWANIINAHSLPGTGIIKGLSSSQHESHGLLLLASMSSKDNLFTDEYIKKTLKMAQDYPETVMGFISQKRISKDPRWIHFTPGVQFASSGDSLGQQYITPQEAICDRGADVIIVGRGILEAKDPFKEAEKYRKAGWEAYNRK